MRAIVVEAGKVEVRDEPKPAAGPGEVLVKVADYQADGFATDTRKLWLQFAATF